MKKNEFKDLLEHNLSKGPHYEPEEEVSADLDIGESIKLIAFYLPQFHQIPENDKWWGCGFTEWTNVTRALPRFEGHYQPHLPGGLGFYDLKNQDVLRRQAKLARRYGIYGFCFHYYWFSGKHLLEFPINSLLENKDIDIKFCINWANENWTRTWDGKQSEILIQQEYKDGDDENLARSFLTFVADSRYIHVEGRPLIIIYRPGVLPDAARTVKVLRKTFLEQGYANPCILMVQAFGDSDPRPYGIDGAVEFPPHKVGWGHREANPELKTFDFDFSSIVFRYDSMIAASLSEQPPPFALFKGVCPGWDNEARKPKRALTYIGSTPEKYGQWLEQVCRQTIENNKKEEQIVFINAWNEWAEGAHLEPDYHFGYAYLAQTRNVHTRLKTAFVGKFEFKLEKASWLQFWKQRILRSVRIFLHRLKLK